LEATSPVNLIGESKDVKKGTASLTDGRPVNVLADGVRGHIQFFGLLVEPIKLPKLHIAVGKQLLDNA